MTPIAIPIYFPTHSLNQIEPIDQGARNRLENKTRCCTLPPHYIPRAH